MADTSIACLGASGGVRLSNAWCCERMSGRGHGKGKILGDPSHVSRSRSLDSPRLPGSGSAPER